MPEPYEAPDVEVLGTVAEITQLNQVGPNPDLVMSSPSSPIR